MQRTTLYITGNRGIYSLHPLSKLTLVAFFLTAAATAPNLFILLAVYLFLLLPLAAISRLLKPFLRASLTLTIPFFISLALIQGFFTQGQTVLLQVSRFAFTLEGFLAGCTAAARILVALSGALLLMLSTRPDYLMLALTQRGLPVSLAYIVLTSIQIFPQFQDRARVIQEAQQSRGLELHVNLFRRLRLLVPLIAPLILSSLVDVEERAMALEARAFSRKGPRTSLLTLHDTTAQRVLRLLLLWALVGLFAWRIRGIFFS